MEIASLPGEIWADVPSFEGLYRVSNKGRVMSLERVVPNKRFTKIGMMAVPAKIKALRRSAEGYTNVTLSKDGKPYVFLLHRLVASVFIPNPDNLPMVNHIDGNPRNNNVENLEWCTCKQNLEHARVVLMNPPNNHKPIRCVETGETFYSGAEAARKYGVSGEGAHILDAARGVRKTCAGYHWEYINK